MHAHVHTRVTHAYTETVNNQCGDYEVNSGEECDAGFSGMIGNDPCCTSACTLREGMNCRCVAFVVVLYIVGNHTLTVSYNHIHTLTCVTYTHMCHIHSHVIYFSDINNQCCENCDYASNTTVCRTFNEGDINCLASVNCDGISKDCPSEVLYLPPDTECRGSGMCLPVGTNCSSE